MAYIIISASAFAVFMYVQKLLKETEKEARSLENFEKRRRR